MTLYIWSTSPCEAMQMIQEGMGHSHKDYADHLLNFSSKLGVAMEQSLKLYAVVMRVKEERPSPGRKRII